MLSTMPLRIAISNDYTIVVAGLAAVLLPYAARVEVVECEAGRPPAGNIDVVLYDTFGHADVANLAISQLLGQSVGARVIIYSWHTDATLVQKLLDVGAAAYLSKATAANDLVGAVERVHAGEQVTLLGTNGSDGEWSGRWPGDELGLSPREAEVLSLICQGYSNQEISRLAFLGINTVKTYIRTTYHKIGVDSRTRAVLWGIDHGFRPDQPTRFTPLDIGQTGPRQQGGPTHLRATEP